ncbi:MAG: hypothetical protein AAGN66_21605 [Acidobacteriota bacterium]
MDDLEEAEVGMEDQNPVITLLGPNWRLRHMGKEPNPVTHGDLAPEDELHINSTDPRLELHKERKLK